MKQYTPKFISFSVREMSVRPNTIRMWANQDQDQELKELAQMVIEAGS